VQIVPFSTHDTLSLLLFLLQPTCFDDNLRRSGNQTWNCRQAALNEANAFLGPPSNELCCLVGTILLIHCIDHLDASSA
jgi:hypothetical protein